MSGFLIPRSENRRLELFQAFEDQFPSYGTCRYSPGKFAAPAMSDDLKTRLEIAVGFGEVVDREGFPWQTDAYRTLL